MVTLRSTIQTEYEEVRTSINERLGSVGVTGCTSDGTAATGNTKCLAIGKLLQFKSGSPDITISYVVARNATASNKYLNMNDEAALRSIKTNLKVVGNASTSSGYTARTKDVAVIPKNIRIEWGGEFAKSFIIPADGSAATESGGALAILHSPISGAVMVFSFPSDPVDDIGTLSLTDGVVDHKAVAIMVKNNLTGFKGAAICIDSGASSVAVRTVVPADNFYNFSTNADKNVKGLCS
jgi:hypothetical protein